MKDDTELLRAYAETRSETAFAEFVERRVGFVYAAALRMVAGDAHTAQDIAQAVFVLVASKAAPLAKHERLAGWLHRTTRNISCRTLRETRRRAACEQEAARMNEIENETPRAFANTDFASADLANTSTRTRVPDAEKLRPLLDEALAALRENECEAVLLRYFEGKPFAEIGAKLKMSDDTAQKCVTRAVKKMRAALAKRGVTSSAAALIALMTAEAAAAQAAPAGLAASVSAGALAATTAAVTSASATGAILALMSSAKITTAAILALLIAVGGAYYGLQSERASTSALAQARQENLNLAAQLRALEKQTAAASAPAPAPKPSSLNALELGQELMTAHPEYKNGEGIMDDTETVSGMARRDSQAGTVRRRTVIPLQTNYTENTENHRV